MPFFRAACSNFLYIQPCLSDCTHQCGWFLSFRGLVLIVQYLANRGEKNPIPKHPPHQLKNRESLVAERSSKQGQLLSMFIKVHPQPLLGESQVRLPNKSQSVIKQETTTLNAYNKHQRTHPANLQHKAIQFRELMDLTIAVKGEFTTNIKAQ